MLRRRRRRGRRGVVHHQRQILWPQRPGAAGSRLRPLLEVPLLRVVGNVEHLSAHQGLSSSFLSLDLSGGDDFLCGRRWRGGGHGVTDRGQVWARLGAELLLLLLLLRLLLRLLLGAAVEEAGELLHEAWLRLRRLVGRVQGDLPHSPGAAVVRVRLRSETRKKN